MDLLIQAFVGFFALLFLHNLCGSGTKHGKTKAMERPQPPGAWPVLGHLHLLRRRPFRETIAAMADEHGPIFLLQLGKRRTLVVSSVEGLKECFTTNDKALTTHPSSALGKFLCYYNAMLGTAPYGPYWRDVRKLTMVRLSKARLEALRLCLAAC